MISHDNSSLPVRIQNVLPLDSIQDPLDPIIYTVKGERNAVNIATPGNWSVLHQHHGFRLVPPDVAFLKNDTVIVVNRKLWRYHSLVFISTQSVLRSLMASPNVRFWTGV